MDRDNWSAIMAMWKKMFIKALACSSQEMILAFPVFHGTRTDGHDTLVHSFIYVDELLTVHQLWSLYFQASRDAHVLHEMEWFPDRTVSLRA